MPASNEAFIKKAFESGLNEQQVKAAVAERNSLKTSPVAAPVDTGNAETNFMPSLANAGKGFVDAVTHPARTASALGSMVLGGAQKLDPTKDNSIVNGLPFGLGTASQLAGNQEDVIDQLVASYKQEYGKGLKEKFNRDPVGMLLDASTLLTGAGAGIKTVGVANKMSKVAKAGEVVSKVGQAVDPIQDILKLTGKGTALVGNVSKRVGAGLTKMGEKSIPLSRLKINEAAGRNFTQSHGKEIMGEAFDSNMANSNEVISTFITKEKLGALPRENAATKYGQMLSEYDTAVSKSGRTAPISMVKEKVVKPLLEKINVDNPTLEAMGLKLRPTIEGWYRKLEQLEKNGQTEVSTAWLREKRIEYDKIVKNMATNSKKFGASTEVADIAVTMRRAFAEAIEEAFKNDKLPNGMTVQELGKKLSLYKDFMAAASPQEWMAGGSKLWKSALVGGIGLGMGALAYGHPGAAALALIPSIGFKALEKAPVIEGLAKGVTRAGKVTTKVATKGDAMMNALMRALQKGETSVKNITRFTQ